MEKAYIILAHKNAAQVSRLISALDDQHSTFFLHLDKNADASPFSHLDTSGQKLVMIKSVATKWGGFGLVEATLGAMQTVADHTTHFDFISLISGQHYPIKSNYEIQNFLSQTRHRAFIEYTTIPDHDRWLPRGGLYRIDSYFFGLGLVQRYTAKTLNFLSKKMGFLKRKFPEHMVPYGGSQWWTIDHYSLQYILQFVKNNKDYVRFQQQSFASDETFFHNILLNAEDESIRNGIVNNNLLYMNWPNKRKAHPEVLGSADFGNLVATDALFARKFDMEQDTAILDLVDNHRASRSVAVV